MKSNKELDKIEAKLKTGEYKRLDILLEIKQNKPEDFDVKEEDEENEELVKEAKEKTETYRKELDTEYPEIAKFLKKYGFGWFKQTWNKMYLLPDLTMEEGQKLSEIGIGDCLQKLREWGFKFIDDCEVTVKYNPKKR